MISFGSGKAGGLVKIFSTPSAAQINLQDEAWVGHGSMLHMLNIVFINYIKEAY